MLPSIDCGFQPVLASAETARQRVSLWWPMRTPFISVSRHACLVWLVVALGWAVGLGAPAGAEAQGGDLALLAPEDGAEVDLDAAELRWADLGPGVRYRVRLVELGVTEPPAEGIARQDPLLDEVTTSASFALGEAAPPLAEGRLYAWRVTALAEGHEQQSRVATFLTRFDGQTVSRRDAVSILLHRHLVPATLDRPVVAYLGRGLVQPGSTLSSFEEPQLRREVTSPSWLGWIDDHPQAFFAHPTRFLLIDAATGRADVIDARWWPVLDGESLWMSDAERRDLGQIVYSELHVVSGEEP